MKKLVLGLVVLAALAAPLPAAAHTTLSFGIGVGPFGRPCPLPLYAAPYGYVPYGVPAYYPAHPYYYPYPYYRYPPWPVFGVGTYYGHPTYFAPRDEGIRSYTLPGYRGWYRR
jgi:hypothetical protein